MDALEYYRGHGPMTDPGEHADLFMDLPKTVPDLCRVVQGLLIHQSSGPLYAIHIATGRKKEKNIRPVSERLALIRARDGRPLTAARAPGERSVGTCRDFALLLTAMLRHQGVPARARCGFAAYFGREMNYDHWATEYWRAGEQRWVLVDPQMDETHVEKNDIAFDVYDVPRDQFIIAGDAWQQCRRGEVSPRRFGFGKRDLGMPYIRGNILLDLLALNKIELLPWDTWWELATRKEMPLGDLLYLDRLAALTLAGDDRLPDVLAAYGDDPTLFLPVRARLGGGAQGAGGRGQGTGDELREERLQGEDAVTSPPAPLVREEWGPFIEHQTPGVAPAGASPAGGVGSLRSLLMAARPVALPPAPYPLPPRAPAAGLDPDKIVIRGAQEHNLKNLDISIPRYKMVVLTGVSGSGKSSLAFDTIYAEGQRRYVESLSPYVRRFLEKVEKPKVDFIGGLSPAIAIEQKTVSKNPRSSVGSITEVSDYLRLLYSRIGTAHCLRCGSAIEPLGAWEIASRLAALPAGTRFELWSPLSRQGKGRLGAAVERALAGGYTTARADGLQVSLAALQPERIKKEQVDLLVAAEEVPAHGTPAHGALFDRLINLVAVALREGDGLIGVRSAGDELLLTDRRICVTCGSAFPALNSGHFSPNSPTGMCAECNGLGTRLEVDVDLIVTNPTISVLDGAIRWYGNIRKKKRAWMAGELLTLAEHYGADLEQPWQDLPRRFRDVVLYGSGEEKFRFTHKSEWDEGSWSAESVRTVKGIVYHIDRLFRQTKSESTRRHYASFMSKQPCASCGGTRLSPEARAVTLNGKTIDEVGAMPIDRLLAWVDGLRDALPAEQLEVAGEALKEVRDRLQFMLNVGLHYLMLDRPAPTLSGGEGQRIRLASQLGCGLVGVLYVLDEPSIGLHARDQRTLLDTLTSLRDMGNTVLVVEHDEETMRAADWLIDLGPGAGVLGGEVVAAGTPEQVAADPRSLTGRYLRHEQEVHSPNAGRRRVPANGWLTVAGARLHNLKSVDARFPLGVMTAVTGVSGSGKSSLVNGTLYPALARALHGADLAPGPHTRIEGLERIDKVIDITQDPIGRTPRSNPATYVGLYDDIRKIFAATPEAIERGYRPDRFSFNVEGGRCVTCKGHGQTVVEMHFLPDVWVTCRECGASRFNRETLAVRYKGKSIAEVLDMDVQEALSFFATHRSVMRTLQTLHDVGLDYVKLGQSATTLSGGEAQRIKLARELSRVATGRTLYILDEPTTGLHFADIQRLLDVLHRLVDAGNSVIVIEHNMDVIKTADWILDLGPEGGDAGGFIVAEGTPEAVAEAEESYTGRFLRAVLERRLGRVA